MSIQCRSITLNQMTCMFSTTSSIPSNYTEQSLGLGGGTRALEAELGDNLDSIAGLRTAKTQNISTLLYTVVNVISS